MADDMFPTVLRGYDKEKVDEYVASSRESVNRLREQIRVYDSRIL